ncbi:MAG: F0F1 ATP synthase subunit delta, partial [Gammaproteobacteria bacterium]|nr:F0F1 ATP synthase subunit delta [Gammaproteobacteria bacterium]
MEERLTAARPYADAAFNFAQQESTLAQWDELTEKLGVVVADPQTQRVIYDPRVTEGQLYELITSVLGADLSSGAQNFVRLLIDAERIQLAPEIATLFGRLRAELEGVADCEIVSAYELDGPETERLTEAVKARLGGAVEVQTSVDKDLIGGVV